MTASPTPLTIISGFLGAGKTSLLNHLLHHAGGRRITALVNDFGALNIDSELIAAEHGGEISLANGCVCCSISDDLGAAMAQALGRTPRPDHIVIEASGVADPARIALYAQVDKDLRLDGIVTLVDASAHHHHSDDPHIGDTYAHQIAAADLFIMSKSDLVDCAQLHTTTQALENLRREVPILPAINGAVETDIILGIGGTHDPHISGPVSPLTDHGFCHWSGHVAPTTDRNELGDKLRGLAPHIIRAKGIFRDALGTYAIHYAGQRISFAPHAGCASGHLVVIGKPELPAPDDLSAYFDTGGAR